MWASRECSSQTQQSPADDKRSDELQEPKAGTTNIALLEPHVHHEVMSECNERLMEHEFPAHLLGTPR